LPKKRTPKFTTTGWLTDRGSACVSGSTTVDFAAMVKAHSEWSRGVPAISSPSTARNVCASSLKSEMKATGVSKICRTIVVTWRKNGSSRQSVSAIAPTARARAISLEGIGNGRNMVTTMSLCQAAFQTVISP